MELVFVHEMVEVRENEEEQFGWKIQQLDHGGNVTVTMEIKVQDMEK